jgi:hypothetical protein
VTTREELGEEADVLPPDQTVLSHGANTETKPFPEFQLELRSHLFQAFEKKKAVINTPMAQQAAWAGFWVLDLKTKEGTVLGVWREIMGLPSSSERQTRERILPIVHSGQR